MTITDAPTDPGGSPGPPAPPRRRRWRRILAGAAVLLMLTTASFGGFAYWASSGSGDGRPVAVVIPEGASAGAIADILADHGVIRAPTFFTLIARLRGVARDLKAGEYELQTGMSYGSVLADLRDGPAVEFVRLTIPEGLILPQVADVVAERTPLGRAEFLSAVRSGRHRPAIMPASVSSLEGYLFPDTYDVLENATADGVVGMLVRQFDRVAASLDWRKAEALGRSPHEIVTIASMIEREARLDEERPLVAAVIYNRLERGMRLQIDATVQYAIYLQAGSYKERLLFRDLEIGSPYNTYRIAGLPPGPIAAPGRASLEAALEPADVDYLYYVLVDPETGRHAFARTAEEHARLKRQAQGR